MPYEFTDERFSRWMSYVLRHNPTRYGLEPDRHGFVDLEAFLSVARRRYPEVTVERLKALIEEGTRSRFEMSDNRVRARYGHSIAVEPPGEPVEPPERLYHGTESARMDRIGTEGLKPVDRRMVHLSSTIDDAIVVASRRTENPVVLRIAAKEAHQAGVAFYDEGKVYLAAQIPPEFVRVEPPSATPTPPFPQRLIAPSGREPTQGCW